MAIGTQLPGGNGPHSLYGKTVSLNMKAAKWLDFPTRDPQLHLDTERPTMTIPERGHINARDLNGIWSALKSGTIVLGEEPVPEFDKQVEVLEQHLNVVKSNYPLEYIKDYTKNTIISGANNQGGYSKIEIFELMIEAEEQNPITGQGGKNRQPVLDWLKECLDYCQEMFGGHSRVRTEKVSGENSSSLKSFPKADMNQAKARKFLGEDE